jgi:hypothetical protein
MEIQDEKHAILAIHLVHMLGKELKAYRSAPSPTTNPSI